MAKDLTAIRIDGESVEKLKQISGVSDGLYHDRSVNWMIGQAVKEFIERHKELLDKQAAFDAEFDRANAGDRKVIASRKSKPGKA